LGHWSPWLWLHCFIHLLYLVKEWMAAGATIQTILIIESD